MKPDNFIIIGNWKMQLSFNEEIEFCTKNIDSLKSLSKKSSNLTITICPSFPALYPITRIVNGSGIYLGAQDCSPFHSGAYTGQVCAESLSQIGCHYCIIGHSERRHYNHETDDEIADKAQRLLEQELQPIICIGETQKESEAKKTFSIVERQLEPVLKRIADFGLSELPIYIAYEPVWSIGTGITPSSKYLNDVFAWLEEYSQRMLGKERLVGVLYGGSVSDKTAPAFKEIQNLSGLLIGGASLDFQKFNNIVNLYSS